MLSDSENNTAMKEDLEYIYTPLAVAKDEVWKRRSDEDLMRRVREFLKDDVPDELKQTPRAVLSRHVVSPNFELLHFLDLAKEVALDPLGLEYVHDKFVPKNDDKYYLAKLIFYEGWGKKGGVKTSSLKVVDFDQYDG